jgi:nucleoside 2-deoxyribosyltransferase
MATKIYLSYGMEYANPVEARARATTLRNKLIGLGYEVFNPYTDESDILSRFNLSSSEELTDLKRTDFDRFLMIMREIRKMDVEELANSDAVIVYLDRSARGGVVGEITLAAATDIPVYSIIEKGDIPHISGWTLSCPDKIFWDMDTCLEYITNNPIL